MSKGSGTRSGLLWEVERLLHECKELPEILLMENVPQVHSKAAKKKKDETGNVMHDEDGNVIYEKSNYENFIDWCRSLENLGYTNFWQDLNAKNYGVAQNRNRTFMVSILQQNVTYKFPKPFPLTKTMKDYLEDEVDERYYINSDKAKQLIDKLIENGTLADRQTDRQTDRQWTTHLKTQEQHQSQTVSVLDMMQESQIERTKEAVLQNIEKYGNKKANYVPFDKAVSYPLHSQDFVRTGFMDKAPTLSSRDYKDPKIVVEKNE